MKKNKKTAKKEFESFLATNSQDKWNMSHEIGDFRLVIRGEQAEMKKFKEDFVGSKKRKLAVFTELLSSISDGFESADYFFNPNGGKTIYLSGDWKYGCYSCAFSEIPLPASRWLKTLSEKFPSLELILLRGFDSSMRLEFKNGDVVEEK